ncbi:MAG: hypothetical protein AB1558_09210, partial [Thermodesulfobacteriota bacterium]
AGQWKGAPFLTDSWELSTAKAERLFGYRSLFSDAAARGRLRDALGACCMEVGAAVGGKVS